MCSMTQIYEWAARWGVSTEALNELLYMSIPDSQAAPGTEAAAQAEIRLAASQRGATLWRNNNGAATDQTGRHIRYGLGNDSAKINKEFKSSDLIGITPVQIGTQIYGIFTAIEVKRPGWKWTATEREQAQWKYMNVVRRHGGIATFATNKKDYETCLTS